MVLRMLSLGEPSKGLQDFSTLFLTTACGSTQSLQNKSLMKIQQLLLILSILPGAVLSILYELPHLTRARF